MQNEESLPAKLRKLAKRFAVGALWRYRRLSARIRHGCAAFGSICSQHFAAPERVGMPDVLSQRLHAFMPAALHNRASLAPAAALYWLQAAAPERGDKADRIRDVACHIRLMLADCQQLPGARFNVVILPSLLRNKALPLWAAIACSMLLPVSAIGTDWTVRLRGAGPIRLGMTLSEVRRVIGDPKPSIEGNEPEVPLEKCAYLTSKRLPSGLGVMFENWRVDRIDVWERGISTVSGAAVGGTEDRVKVLYPRRISVDPDGHYLNYSTRERVDHNCGIVFETDGSKVTSFRTGTLAAIALVEGCS